MEVNQLRSFVLLIVLTGMVLAAGALVFDNFGDAVQVSDNSTNETVALASGTATVANREIIAISYFGNMSHNLTEGTTADFNVTTDSGTIDYNKSWTAGNYNITYTYDRNVEASYILNNMTAGIAPIAGTWIPLIITIAVLAIIMVLVIRSFGAGKRR